MGTIADKLSYLDETKEKIREAANSIAGGLSEKGKLIPDAKSFTITEETYFRSYASRIETLAHPWLFRKIGSLLNITGQTDINIIPYPILPEDDPNSIHEDEELMWPKIDWDISMGSDNDWHIPEYPYPIVILENYQISKSLKEYSIIQDSIPRETIGYWDEDNIFDHTANELIKLLSGSEMKITLLPGFYDKNKSPIDNEITFSEEYDDLYETLQNNIGKDSGTIFDEFPETNVGDWNNLILGSFRTSTGKFEHIPSLDFIIEYDEEGEIVDRIPLTEEIIENKLKEYLEGSEDYEILDRESDTLIPEPIENEPTDIMNPIWNSVYWMIGSDEDWEDDSGAVVKRHDFYGDSHAKGIEFNTVIRFSNVLKDIERKSEMYYYDKIQDTLFGDGIGEIEKIMPQYEDAYNVIITKDIDDRYDFEYNVSKFDSDTYYKG